MTTPSSPHSAAAKKAIIETFLSTGGVVRLFLDARHPDAVTPKAHAATHDLNLDIGLDARMRIPDLELDDIGIGATLSFGGRGQWCFVPWSALWGARCDFGRALWYESVPPELRNSGNVTPAAVVRGGGKRVTQILPPRPDNVINLDARRTPKDRHEVAWRRGRAAAAKLTAPSTGGVPGTDGAA
jgi:hypothetical protein